MPPATFDKVLEIIGRLSADEQVDLLEVVRRRLAERGRRRVTKEINEARSQFKRGKARPASVDEIMRKIES